MPGDAPFVLFDDARESGGADARIYSAPEALFVARRSEEVAQVLEAANAARAASGGTLAGYLAYEAGLAFEPRLAPRAAARTGAAGPLAWFGLFGEPEIVPAADMPQWLAQRATAEGSPASIGPLEPQVSLAAYLQRFARLQEAIRAGDIYQANLTLPLAGPARGHPLAIYAAIRPAARAGYGGVVFDGAHWLLSFSPELFFTLQGREARCKPMKGTRPRGRDAAEDQALADELAASVKDRAENLMIVDLMRNDLSRVAEAGSVRVEEAFAVETYPTLHTMTTTVRGRLEEGRGALDMLGALFPCGSITGAPKIRAMELIDGVEAHARGPYCGAIGWIGPEGDAAFNVAIRTVRLTPGENARHKAVLGVGGAIVADSEGMAEWRECLVKGGFVRGEAGGYDLIETMRVDRGIDGSGTVALLELHLDRLEASAGALGFAFDRQAIAARIPALVEKAEGPMRLRLLLARGGAPSFETGPLPPALPDPAPVIALPHPTVPGDWRLGHKTTDRGFYEAALAAARSQGAVEALLVRADGLLTEGSWTSLFVERDGLLLTPPLALGLLPGVLRHSLVEEGRAVEAELRVEDLADGFFIGNALRGLIRARLES